MIGTANFVLDSSFVYCFRLNGVSLNAFRTAKHIDRNAEQAKALYGRANQEGSDVIVMFNLAHLLQYGPEGIKRDNIRARELYGTTIKDVNHIYFQFDAKGIGGEAIQAKVLYGRPIQEGNHIKLMFN